MAYFAIWFDPATQTATAAQLSAPLPKTNAPYGPTEPTRPTPTSKLCGVFEIAEGAGNPHRWMPR